MFSSLNIGAGDDIDDCWELLEGKGMDVNKTNLHSE